MNAPCRWNLLVKITGDQDAMRVECLEQNYCYCGLVDKSYSYYCCCCCLIDSYVAIDLHDWWPALSSYRAQSIEKLLCIVHPCASGVDRLLLCEQILDFSAARMTLLMAVPKRERERSQDQFKRCEQNTKDIPSYFTAKRI